MNYSCFVCSLLGTRSFYLNYDMEIFLSGSCDWKLIFFFFFFLWISCLVYCFFFLVFKSIFLALCIYEFSWLCMTLACRFDSLIFMNSRSAEASEVSCKSGNNNDLCFFWILFCLLPKFLGTPFAYVNFLLIKAIDRSPSAFAVINP